MTLSEYFLSFETILYGLIISRILVKWSSLMKNDKPQSHYWTYYLLTINVFLLIIYIYWSNRDSLRLENITNPLSFLLYVVVPPSVFTFMTYQMFPDRFAQVNLKEYVLKNRKGIFIPWVGYFVYYIIVFNTNWISPITIFAFILIGIAGIIVLHKKNWPIEIFVILFTIFQFYMYTRFYLLNL